MSIADARVAPQVRHTYGRGIVLHRFVAAGFTAVGPREFRCNAGSADLQSDGFALDPLGADLTRIQGGPLLWQHGRDAPDPVIGTVKSMTATATQLPTLCEFLAPGDPFTDSVCQKLKRGAPYGLSLGFTIEEFEWLPGRAGRRATKWTAMELSLCAVPIDKKAIITARARVMRNMDAITAAQSHLATALDEHGAIGRCRAAHTEAAESFDQHHRRAGRSLNGFVQAHTDGNQDGAAKQLAQCQRHCAGMARDCKAMGSPTDLSDAVGSMTRAMHAAAAAGGYDTDSDVVQSSGGAAEDQGSRSRDPDYLRRQRELEEIKLAAQDY